jgi:hypothetical protein
MIYMYFCAVDLRLSFDNINIYDEILITNKCTSLLHI